MIRRRRQIEQQLQSIADGGRLPAGSLEDPDDIETLRVAIELRAGRPAADLPSEDFVAALHDKLREEQEPSTPRRGLSRRALIAGAGAAAAAAAAAVAVDRTLLDHNHGGTSVTAAADLAPNDGEWIPLSPNTAVGPGAVQRFTTSSVVGFVSEHDGKPVAVSGACTHLGCLLQPNTHAGRLDCPCHRTAFGYDGRVLFSQLDTPPPPLPRIEARQRDGAVEVFVPRQA